MASGSLTVCVRPLRVAFLVDPSDRAGLFSAIEACTFLWGGSFNPIIPAYKRTPKKWERHRVRKLLQPQEIITGYLDAFDPDVVVPVGVSPAFHRRAIRENTGETRRTCGRSQGT